MIIKSNYVDRFLIFLFDYNNNYLYTYTHILYITLVDQSNKK